MRRRAAAVAVGLVLAALAGSCSSSGDRSAGPATTVGLRPVVFQDVETWLPKDPDGRPCPEGVAPWRTGTESGGYRATFSSEGVERFAIVVSGEAATVEPSLHVMDDSYRPEAVDHLSTFKGSGPERDIEAAFGSPAADWRYLRCGQVDDARYEVTREAGRGVEKVAVATLADQVVRTTTSACPKAWPSGGGTHLACVVEGEPSSVEVLDAASGATRSVPIVGTTVGPGLGVVVVDVTGAIEPGDSADVAPRPSGTSTVVLRPVSVGPDGFRRPR